MSVCRLKKKELATFAQSAKDELRDVEESVKRDLSASLHSLQDSVADILSKPSKPSTDRVKMVISIQDKDGTKQFRVYAVFPGVAVHIFTYIEVCTSVVLLV